MDHCGIRGDPGVHMNQRKGDGIERFGGDVQVWGADKRARERVGGGGGEEGRGGSSRTAVQKPVREPGAKARPGTPETRKAAGGDFSDYEETRCRKNAKVGIGRKRMERAIR